jgi:hypothetical protein
MIRVFYNQTTRRLEIRNLIGPKNRLPEILEWLRERHGLIPIEEYVLQIPVSRLTA